MAISRRWLISTCAGGLLAIGGFLTAAYVAAPSQKAPPLPALNVDPNEVTVVGNSSGAFMAIQVDVAYSGTFRGVASVGGGPYFCTEGSIVTGLKRCVGKNTSGVPTSRLVAFARNWAAEGKIDPVAGMAAQKVYVFRGQLDKYITLDVAQSIVDFYGNFVQPQNIVTNFHTPVAHGWVSPYGTNSCLSETENYINKCSNIDVAAEFLTLFYGPLNPKTNKPLTGMELEFDQNEFFDNANAESHSADEFGFAYVPADCAKGESCRAVIALHGCDQDYGKIDKIFFEQSGINQWADTNRIVVVYPQVKAANLKGNGRGCWDTIGYDGDNFAWKSGSQVKLIKRIADRITAKRGNAKS